MKQTIIVTLYLIVIAATVALLISDFDYSYLSALFISSCYLPTLVVGYILLRNFKFEKTLRGTVAFCCFVLGLYFMQVLLIALANFALQRLNYLKIDVPHVLINPIFIL
ncbi:MAG: hypothetical protein R3Y50_05190 [Rikenellaceae bacterium]